MQTLDALSPDNMRMDLMTSTFDEEKEAAAATARGDALQTEPWFNVRDLTSNDSAPDSRRASSAVSPHAGSRREGGHSSRSDSPLVPPRCVAGAVFFSHAARRAHRAVAFAASCGPAPVSARAQRVHPKGTRGKTLEV